MNVIEEKKRERNSRYMFLSEEIKKKEFDRFESLRRSREGIITEQKRRNELILGRAGRSAGILAPSSALLMKQGNSLHTSSVIPDEKAKLVQKEALKVLEEKKKQLSEKMMSFNRRMKENERKLQERQDERKEQSRQWYQTLKLNVSKKKKKESYRRKLLAIFYFILF